VDRVDLLLLDQCVARSLDLLRRSFHVNTLGGGGGWYHSLEVDRPGPSATAVGMASFLMFDEPNDHLTNALSFLKGRQISSSDEILDGGWAVNTSSGFPLTEATALISRILILTRVMLLPDSPDVRRAHAWLVHNQNVDGGWGSFLGHPSRTWLTAMAVRSLSELNPHGDAFHRGVQWLIDHRDPVTLAWGERPLSPPTATHTAYVLTALVDSGFVRTDSTILDAAKHGYDWFQSHVNVDSVHDDAARVESYNLTRKAQRSRPVTFHSTVWHPGLPFAISALVRHPIHPDSRLISRAVTTLLANQQPDGQWPNPDSAAGVSVWSVWPFLDAIADIKQHNISRPGDLLTWFGSDTVVIQHGSARGTKVIKLERRARLNQWRAIIARHFASVILGLFIIFGSAGALLDKISWPEFVLGLGVPVLLFLLQEGLNRAKPGGAPSRHQ
jgi:hypothetical protein